MCVLQSSRTNTHQSLSKQFPVSNLSWFSGSSGACQVEVARLGLGFTQVVLDLMKGGVRMVEEHDGIDAIESVQ